MYFFNKNRVPVIWDYVMCLFGLPMAVYYHTIIGIPMAVLIAWAALFPGLVVAYMVTFVRGGETMGKWKLYLMISIVIHHVLSCLSSFLAVFLTKRNMDAEGDQEPVNWESGNEKYVVSPFKQDMPWVHYVMAILDPVAEIASITSVKSVIAGAFVANNVITAILFPRFLQTARYLVAGGEKVDFRWPSALAFIAYKLAIVFSVVIVIMSKSKGNST